VTSRVCDCDFLRLEDKFEVMRQYSGSMRDNTRVIRDLGLLNQKKAWTRLKKSKGGMEGGESRDAHVLSDALTQIITGTRAPQA
jgi:hypothetical protein